MFMELSADISFINVLKQCFISQRIIGESSIPEMREWSILLIQSYFKIVYLSKAVLIQNRFSSDTHHVQM